jgi:hypothetical protein
MTRAKYITAQAAWQEMVNLKVGDKVLVCREAVRGEFGWDNTWPEVMNGALYHEDFEKTATVNSLGSDENGIMLSYEDEDGDKRCHAFPFFVLEKVVPTLPENIKISSSYEVEFKADGSIEVGCQKIPLDLLEKIYNTAKSVVP